VAIAYGPTLLVRALMFFQLINLTIPIRSDRFCLINSSRAASVIKIGRKTAPVSLDNNDRVKKKRLRGIMFLRSFLRR